MSTAETFSQYEPEPMDLGVGTFEDCIDTEAVAFRLHAADQAENYRYYLMTRAELGGGDPLQYIELDDRTVVRLFRQSVRLKKDN